MFNHLPVAPSLLSLLSLSLLPNPDHLLPTRTTKSLNILMLVLDLPALLVTPLRLQDSEMIRTLAPTNDSRRLSQALQSRPQLETRQTQCLLILLPTCSI
ncbi:hypothetical protein BKA93DRAFT_789628 [Sparassis latifolia]